MWQKIVLMSEFAQKRELLTQRVDQPDLVSRSHGGFCLVMSPSKFPARAKSNQKQ
jgi:hypothetical protein